MSKKPPRAPDRPFFLFKEHRLSQAREAGKKDPTLTDLAEEFKNLDKKTKNQYEQLYSNERIQYEKAIKDYIEKHGLLHEYIDVEDETLENIAQVEKPQLEPFNISDISLPKTKKFKLSPIGPPCSNYPKEYKFRETAKRIVDIINSNPEQIYRTDYDNRDSLIFRLFHEGVNTSWFCAGSPQQRIIDASLPSPIIAKKPVVFFPTDVTQRIFAYCENPSSNTSHLASQRGVGKSFSLALYVLLKRFDEKFRIFFLNNMDAFSKNPIDCFASELEYAFHIEIKEVPTILTKIKKARESRDEAKLREIFYELATEAKKKNKEFLVVLDQVNRLDELLAESTLYKQLLETMLLWLKDFNIVSRLIQMSSLTTDQITKNKDTTYMVDFNPSIDPNCSIEFIMERFCYTIQEVEIQQILNKTDGNYLEINNIATAYYTNNKQLDLNLYELKTLDDIKTAMERFMSNNNKRKEAMMAAWFSLCTHSSALPSRYSKYQIDQRYLVVVAHPKITTAFQITPLFPLVRKAMSQIFTQLSTLEEMIRLFKGNYSVLGFVLEYLILTLCQSYIPIYTFKTPKKTAQNKNNAGDKEVDDDEDEDAEVEVEVEDEEKPAPRGKNEKKKLEKKTRKKTEKKKDKKSTSEMRILVKSYDADLKLKPIFIKEIKEVNGQLNDALYIPEKHTFPAFDAFFITKEIIFAIQIKISFTKAKVDDYVEVIREIESNTPKNIVQKDQGEPKAPQGELQGEGYMEQELLETTLTQKFREQDYYLTIGPEQSPEEIKEESKRIQKNTIRATYTIAKKSQKKLVITFVSKDSPESSIFQSAAAYKGRDVQFGFSNARDLVKHLCLDSETNSILFNY